MTLSPLEELAWRTRIEGSRGVPERERLGPIPGRQSEYRTGIAALGADFSTVDPAEQDARLDANPEFRDLLYEHVVEGAYAAPEYGGNRDLRGWYAIGFPGDVQPRGYTDAEVEGKSEAESENEAEPTADEIPADQRSVARAARPAGPRAEET